MSTSEINDKQSSSGYRFIQNKKYLKDINAKLASSEYDFLRNNEHLGENIILLALGGSYAYGTNIKTSDLDIRGTALMSKLEILTGQNFEQVEDRNTDTVIYSFNKLVTLLAGVNPNVIEILGLKPEHYLYLSPIGQELLNNRKLFLSQRCINTFGGYANQQFYQLQQKITRAHKKINQGDDPEKHRGKIAKHMMHLLRLYAMVYDILTQEEIITYRKGEHDLLMKVRKGEYLDENLQPTLEFFDILHNYFEKRFAYAKTHTSLPEKPRTKEINEFLASVNERVVKDEI